METLKLSLCITNYNRTDMLLEAFKNILLDPRITEIIICDDGSDNKTVEWVVYNLTSSQLLMEKIKIRLHPGNNVGMYENKKRAIEYASNEWCILFDSDNILDSSYIDAFYDLLADPSGNLHEYEVLDKDCIYCPDFAKPRFDYRSYSGHTYNRENVGYVIEQPMFECLLNTCNYIVYKETYLRKFMSNSEIGAADTIYFNYHWLQQQGRFFVVPGMEYEHRIHSGSGFMQDVSWNMQKAKAIKNLIKLL